MSVQFSELHVLKGKFSWSPNGQYLATTERNQLMIRHGGSLQIMAVHTNNDLIDKIEWSYDSRLILCMCRKRGIVQIWSVKDPKWEATIDEGFAGLSNAMWSPCNKHILTVSEFQIRLTIWSLIDGTAKYIKYPKSHNKCIKFSHNGNYLAVVERVNHKDIIGIYSVEYWQLIHRFGIDFVTDCNDIIWSHNDEYISIYNNSLHYKFVIYTARGRKITQYSAYDNQLGIKSMNWSLDDQFMAVGSYDNNVRIFNTMTWRMVSQFKCENKLDDSKNYQLKSTIIYKETLDNNNNNNNNDNDNGNDNSNEQKNQQIDSNYENKENSSNKNNKNNNNNNNSNKYRSNSKTRVIGWNENKNNKNDKNGRMEGKTCYILKNMPLTIDCINNKKEMNDETFTNSYNNNNNNNNSHNMHGNGSNGAMNRFEIGFGISSVEWSCDNRFLAIKCDEMENVLWIWDMKYLVFHSILINLSSIKQFSWNNINNRIECAISCNNDNLYLWSKKGCVVIRTIASRFTVQRIYWKPKSFDVSNKGSLKKKEEINDNSNENEQDDIDTGCIALIDREHFCCCYDLNF